MKLRQDKPAQFLANVEAWRAAVGAPLIILIKSSDDRCIVKARDNWLRWLSESPAVEPWKRGIARHKPFGGKVKTVKWGVRGIRIFGAVQIVVHLYEGKLYLEIDFDLANPGRGALPAGIHVVEVVWLRRSWLVGRPKYKTDPYRIAELMRKDGIEVEAV